MDKTITKDVWGRLFSRESLRGDSSKFVGRFFKRPFFCNNPTT